MLLKIMRYIDALEGRFAASQGHWDLQGQRLVSQLSTSLAALEKAIAPNSAGKLASCTLLIEDLPLQCGLRDPLFRNVFARSFKQAKGVSICNSGQRGLVSAELSKIGSLKKCQ